jgi:large subunit ribosomal protein L25
MAILKLTADPRTGTGSNSSRALRETGFIPANLYSHGTESTMLQLNATTWSKALGMETHLVMLDITGAKPEMAALREIQRDPMTQKIIHVDLLRIKMDEAVHFSIKIEFTGTPKGAKDGGVTQIMAGHVEVECLPTDVPDFLSVDITGLGLGESIHARDLAIPEGVKLITDPDVALVSVAVVRVVASDKEIADAAAAAVAAAEAAEAEEKEKAKPKPKV